MPHRPSTTRLPIRTVLGGLVCLAGLASCRTGGISDLPTQPAVEGEIVLQWFRSGGVAGFCDELTITEEGLASIGSCTDEFPGLLQPRPVPADEWFSLQSWLATVDAYTDVLTDDADADGLTLTIVFNGTGVGEAGEEEKEALREFTSQLYSRMRQLIESGCTVTAIASVDVYREPDLDGEILAELAEGDVVQMLLQTSDGWLAFAPPAPSGTARVFKLRWLAPNAQLTKETGCEVLPLATPAAAGVCYFSAAVATPVQAGPSQRSATIAMLPEGGVLPVTAMTGTGWLQVDPSGSGPGTAVAWVLAPDADPEGVCGELPTVDS